MYSRRHGCIVGGYGCIVGGMDVQSEGMIKKEEYRDVFVFPCHISTLALFFYYVIRVTESRFSTNTCLIATLYSAITRFMSLEIKFCTILLC